LHTPVNGRLDRIVDFKRLLHAKAQSLGLGISFVRSDVGFHQTHGAGIILAKAVEKGHRPRAGKSHVVALAGPGTPTATAATKG
jgi:hypothetical protein